MKRYTYILMAVCLLLWPSLVLANGLIPAVNAYRNTPAFWFVFAVVVLIESVCMRLWLRPIHLVSALWRVLTLNAISSFAGYLLMRSPFGPDFTYVWQQAIPFFFLTLCVELPLLLLLFRGTPTSWRRKLLLGTFANVLSYAFLILAERRVESIWLDRLRATDKQILSQWVDSQMLTESTGRIYGTESRPGLPLHRLRFFDLSDGEWHSLRASPAIHPRLWDIEGELMVFGKDEEGYPQGNITVAHIPDFEVLQKIPLTNIIRTMGLSALQISPDKRRLALLVPLYQTEVHLRRNKYRGFPTYEIVVLDLSSGAVLGRCPRKVLRGVCWSPDAQHVLFTSLRDQKLHEPTMLEEWKKYTEAEADKLLSDTPTYAYNPDTGSVEIFGDMNAVHLATEVGLLIYKDGQDKVCLLNPATGQTNSVSVGHLGYRDITVSPDGKLAVLHLTLHHPLAYLGYPTIVDLTNPERRHYIDGFDYRLDWTTYNKSRTRASTATNQLAPLCVTD